MKKIILPVQLRSEIILEHEESVSLTQMITEAEIARKNGSKIIWSSLSLEQQINTIILQYFFQDDKEKASIFQNYILLSEWFSFNAKRKFLIALINLENLLEREDKTKFENCSKKIISLRNAFAHGEIIQKQKKFL